MSLAEQWRRLMSGLGVGVRPKLLAMDAATKAGVSRVRGRVSCNCLAQRSKRGRPIVHAMHTEAQDEAAAGWVQMLDLVGAARDDARHVLEPAGAIAWDDWMKVITLPAAIGELDQVEELWLYGSNLRRIPPEIGRLQRLRKLDIYTSYGLHWLPYEVTRCKGLRESRMSTRALYGNRKTRLPFPRLHGPVPSFFPKTCSVCDRTFGERAPSLYWITLEVATDIVPLLVHSCSADCTKSLPSAPKGYFERPHRGGGGVGMPEV